MHEGYSAGNKGCAAIGKIAEDKAERGNEGEAMTSLRRSNDEPNNQLLRKEAEILWEQNLDRPWRQKWEKMTGRFETLLNLGQVSAAAQINSRRDAGLQEVPVAKIMGSLGRSREFTCDFRPLSGRLRERWVNVANVQLSGRGLPPVSLIKFGDVYFVVDGHHRVSVAHALGQETIDAHVVSWDPGNPN
jgi:hypothetical protein